MIHLQGVGASGGVCVGPAVLLQNEAFEVPNVDNPMAALATSVAAVAEELRSLSDDAKAMDRSDASEVLQAQSFMAQDPMIIDAVEANLAKGQVFDGALKQSSSELQQMLASLPDPYLAARAADIGEVFDRVRRHLAGLPSASAVTLTEPSVLCAATLTAAQTATLDPTLVLGLATVDGGPTSHVAIIARAMGVPAVVGISNLIESIASGLVESVASGSTIALDGDTGELIINPDDAAQTDFQQRIAEAAIAAEAAALFRGVKITVDGTPIHVAANVANDTDLDRAIEEQADGIGLFRTEFLYLDRPAPPTEDEQVEVYRRALAAFSEPVVVRTFDIGGDKPASFLELPEEENPFLGVRGVRLYKDFPDLFMTQVRALLRSAPAGDLWVMVPMIATASEVHWVQEMFAKGRADLESEGIEAGRISLGAMVEVPSAALLAEALAEDLDFLSIGTNDLTQYTLAADRTNGKVDHLSDPLHPAVLELCRLTAEAGKKRGISVSVCGLAAADPIAGALFIEMGIGKLSVAGPAVNATKAAASQLDRDGLKQLTHAVSKASDGPEVRSMAAQFYNR